MRNVVRFIIALTTCLPFIPSAISAQEVAESASAEIERLKQQILLLQQQASAAQAETALKLELAKANPEFAEALIRAETSEALAAAQKEAASARLDRDLVLFDRLSKINVDKWGKAGTYVASTNLPPSPLARFEADQALEDAMKRACAVLGVDTGTPRYLDVSGKLLDTLASASLVRRQMNGALLLVDSLVAKRERVSTMGTSQAAGGVLAAAEAFRLVGGALRFFRSDIAVLNEDVTSSQSSLLAASASIHCNAMPLVREAMLVSGVLDSAIDSLVALRSRFGASLGQLRTVTSLLAVESADANRDTLTGASGTPTGDATRQRASNLRADLGRYRQTLAQAEALFGSFTDGLIEVLAFAGTAQNRLKGAGLVRFLAEGNARTTTKDGTFSSNVFASGTARVTVFFVDLSGARSHHAQAFVERAPVSVREAAARELSAATKR